jgi:hypothetical protein
MREISNFACRILISSHRSTSGAWLLIAPSKDLLLGRSISSSWHKVEVDEPAEKSPGGSENESRCPAFVDKEE